MRANFVSAVVLTAIITATPSRAASELPPRFELEFEGGAVWTQKNDVQIPNDDTGTRFSMKDLIGGGPDAYWRLSATYNLNRKHAFRLTYAPLSVDGTGEFDEPVDFQGETYEAGVPTKGYYRFTTPRLTWRYLFYERPDVRLRGGLTLLVRDAEIRLTQGETTSSDDDLGLVPLLHFDAAYDFDDLWTAALDVDAAAAPQGRAIDLALRAERRLSPSWTAFGGVRLLEGGADNDQLYSFAWFNYAFFGARYGFGGAAPK